jgi:carboxymethylenebutenolidase
MNEISRRTFVKGVAATAPLALVLSDPRLAAAVAAGLETVTIATGDGRKVSGALAVPAKTPAPAVLLIHEWWGLNDQIKSVAAEFAKLGYLALALDLYDGKLAKDGDRETANNYRKAVKEAEGNATVSAWIEWLTKHGKGNGKVGTVGWCFGGGWSLNASIARPVDASVV